MKFLLVLSVCSATFQTCLPPVSNDVIYDSHFDCATAGYLNALGVMRELGIKETNKQRLVVSFQCNVVPTAGVRHYKHNQ